MKLFPNYRCLVGYTLVEVLVVLAVIVILAGITFGTAAMHIQEDNKDVLKFSTRHINEIYIAEDDKGGIDSERLIEFINKFITGKNIKFGIVKSDYQKDFNLLILKSKQYFKNDNSWIDNELENPL